jgi:hypothetical protein
VPAKSASTQIETPVGARDAWRIRDWYLVGGAAAVVVNWLALYPETRHDVGSLIAYVVHFPPFVVVSLALIAAVSPILLIALLLWRRATRSSGRAFRLGAWLAAVVIGAAAMHYEPIFIFNAYELATSNDPLRFASPDPFFTVRMLYMQGATSLAFFSVPLLFKRFRIAA